VLRSISGARICSMAGKRRLQRTAVVSGNAAYDTCTCRGRVFRTHARADVGRVVELGTALTRRDPLGRRAVGGRHVPGQRHGVASGDAVRADGGPVVGAAGRRCVHGRQRRRAPDMFWTFVRSNEIIGTLRPVLVLPLGRSATRGQRMRGERNGRWKKNGHLGKVARLCQQDCNDMRAQKHSHKCSARCPALHASQNVQPNQRSMVAEK
jgi:hypothetical protein